jgi:hypothetical protein
MVLLNPEHRVDGSTKAQGTEQMVLQSMETRIVAAWSNLKVEMDLG